MSFTRVNPGSWAVNDQLTSAQMNSLDTDHANSVDKSTAGDTISGAITVSGASASITIAGSATTGLVVNSGSKIDVNGNLNLKSGCSATVQGGCTLTVASSGAIVINSAATASVSLGTGSSVTTVNGTSGQISLGNGPSDIKISPSASYSVVLPVSITGYLASSGFVVDGTKDSLRGNGTVNAIVQTPFRAHHNATLASVVFYFAVVGGHGALPTNQFTVGVYRRDTTSTIAWLNASQYISPGSVTVGAYQALTSLTYTCNQNNVIDLSTGYTYYWTIQDENGSNALTGNQFYALKLNYTTIADYRFA